MNRLSNTLFVLSIGAAMAVVPATAQSDSNSAMAPNNTNTHTSSKSSAGKPISDSEFVTKAAQGGMAEVELGQLAEQKATNPEVKKFAERMVNDHTKTNDQLKQVAEKEHLSLPQTVDQKDKLTKARLEKLSGERFDRAYMANMVKDHRKDVSEFQVESKNVQDPQLKNFVDETLPTLRDHLKQAEKIAPTTSTKGTSHSQTK